MQLAWTDLASWILTTGYRSDLVRTGTPTADQLKPVTDLMTTARMTSFDEKARTRGAEDIDSLESITAIGTTYPDATPISGNLFDSGLGVPAAVTLRRWA